MDHIDVIIERYFNNLNAERKSDVKEKMIALESNFSLRGKSLEDVMAAIETISSMFGTAIKIMKRSMENVTMWFDEYYSALEYVQEQKRKRELHKLIFIRPVIHHQVLERKPKQLIRKVIH